MQQSRIQACIWVNYCQSKIGRCTFLLLTFSYGFQTSTNVKILLIFEQQSEPFVDDEVQVLFKAILSVYLSYVSNPFVGTDMPMPQSYQNKEAHSMLRSPLPLSTDLTNAPITCPRFHDRIVQILGL